VSEENPKEPIRERNPIIRALTFMAGLGIGMFAVAILEFAVFATLVSGRNPGAGERTVTFGAVVLSFLLALVTVGGIIQVARRKPWPLKLFVLGLLAGACLGFLLEGACFVVMQSG
jgi:hypothetical protein